MKIFIALLCLCVGLYLLVHMFKNLQLNQSLQLKKATLGYKSNKTISYTKGIPAFAMMLVGCALLLPSPTITPPSDQPVAMMTRNLPEPPVVTLAQPVNLVKSLQTYNQEPIIGTIMVNDFEYSVVISENQLFYLDYEQNMYENSTEE